MSVVVEKAGRKRARGRERERKSGREGEGEGEVHVREERKIEYAIGSKIG